MFCFNNIQMFFMYANEKVIELRKNNKFPSGLYDCLVLWTVTIACLEKKELLVYCTSGIEAFSHVVRAFYKIWLFHIKSVIYISLFHTFMESTNKFRDWCLLGLCCKLCQLSINQCHICFSDIAKEETQQAASQMHVLRGP